MAKKVAKEINVDIATNGDVAISTKGFKSTETRKLERVLKQKQKVRSDFFHSIIAESRSADTDCNPAKVEVNISQGGEGPKDKMLLQLGTEDSGFAIAYLTDKQAERLAKAIRAYLSCPKGA